MTQSEQSGRASDSGESRPFSRSIVTVLEITSATGAAALVAAAFALKLNLDAMKPGLFNTIDVSDIVSISLNSLFVTAAAVASIIPALWLGAMAAVRLARRLPWPVANRVGVLVLTAILGFGLMIGITAISGIVTGEGFVFARGSLALIVAVLAGAFWWNHTHPLPASDRARLRNTILALSAAAAAAVYYQSLKDTLQFQDKWIPANTLVSDQKLCTTLLQPDANARNHAVIFLGAKTMIVDCDGRGNFDVIKNPSSIVISVR